MYVSTIRFKQNTRKAPNGIPIVSTACALSDALRYGRVLVFLGPFPPTPFPPFPCPLSYAFSFFPWDSTCGRPNMDFPTLWIQLAGGFFLPPMLLMGSVGIFAKAAVVCVKLSMTMTPNRWDPFNPILFFETRRNPLNIFQRIEKRTFNLVLFNRDSFFMVEYLLMLNFIKLTATWGIEHDNAV